VVPTDLALNLLGFVSHSTFDLHFLLFGVLLALFNFTTSFGLDWAVVVRVDVGCNKVGSVVFDQKFETTHLDCIALVDFVLSAESGLIFTLRLRLHIPHDDEHLVLLCFNVLLLESVVLHEEFAICLAQSQ